MAPINPGVVLSPAGKRTLDSLKDNNKLLLSVLTLLQRTPDLSTIIRDALAASVFSYLSDR